MQEILTKELGMEITIKRNTSKGRDQKFIRFAIFGNTNISAATGNGASKTAISLKREFKKGTSEVLEG
jgi:hypothetical protein